MFSGIVEATARILSARRDREIVRIDVERPVEFDDIRIGDSICTNGVCLTIEEFDSQRMTFALGDETLRITRWSEAELTGRQMNLERSLRMGDRIHGHMVSGHVDATGKIIASRDLGGSLFLEVNVPQSLHRLIWKKGSVAINGVSLTVNSFENGNLTVCLIPETLKRTNLAGLKPGDDVNLEADFTARALVSAMETMLAEKSATLEKKL